MIEVYLSHRNIDALLSKLQRVANGDDSSCCIIKYKSTNARFQQTPLVVSVQAIETGTDYYTNSSTAVLVLTRDTLMALKKQTMINVDGVVNVWAIETEEYYAALERPAGEMHPLDEENLEKPAGGVKL